MELDLHLSSVKPLFSSNCFQGLIKHNYIYEGDVIDGKSAENSSQLNCLRQLKSVSKNLPYKLLYCFGNHCHYSFDRASLVNHFISDKPWLMKPMRSISSSQCTPSRIYYHWSPYPGWRFISVDSYDVSLIGSSSIANKNLAEKLLAQNNPNDLKISGTWFKNLPYQKRRWVPYNGGEYSYYPTHNTYIAMLQVLQCVVLFKINFYAIRSYIHTYIHTNIFFSFHSQA